MKFRYDGEYICFMGRAFVNGAPVEVTDKATIAALRKRSDFKEVIQVEETKQEAAPKPPVLKRSTITLRGRR